MRIVYLFTRFPERTETFLQREVSAMLELGVELELYSLWGGGKVFLGRPIRRFPKLALLSLLWRLPREAARRPSLVPEVFRAARGRAAPSLLNVLENLLGSAFAVVCAERFRQLAPDRIHAVWATAPGAAGWLLSRMTGIPFSVGAHAFDLFENGGDWLLREKIAAADFVHTSTEVGLRRLLEIGAAREKILMLRRGLIDLPEVKPLRLARSPLRIVCNARLVPKKGIERQIEIYAALARAGIPFEARLFGSGPLRKRAERLIETTGLAGRVLLMGHRPQHEIQQNLRWADVLIHTGVVAPNGDRDGLPNAIPEAMAVGTMVVSSPVAGAGEAIFHEETGLLADVDRPRDWVAAFERLMGSDSLAEHLRRNARLWVEQNFDARKNTARLLRRFCSASEEGAFERSRTTP